MALQAAPGPQTTAWLLPSVPNCAGVALSSEWLVYSFHSFQPVVCSLPVRACALHPPSLASMEREFFPSEKSFPPFPLNSRHIHFKFPRQDTENFLKLIGLTDLLTIEKWEILVNSQPENAVKSLYFKNRAERLKV